MLSSPLVVCALALLCWPTRRGEFRLNVLDDPSGIACVRSGSRLSALLVAMGCFIALAFAAFGPAGAVVAALFGGTGWNRWKARSERRARNAARTGLAEALGHFVAELRAGAHPAAAAESVSTDALPDAAAALRAIASATRLGGDIDAALTGVAVTTPELRSPLLQLGRAWALAQRHGIPLAEVADAVRRDMAACARFAAQTHAKMAGPRASASVLTGLPLLGLGLGEAMGAQPLRLLASSTAGQFLLLVGAALIWAGMLWSGRLTEVGEPS
ncbi:MAG: type II secretion system F family protein [Haloechinothrix sp.]